MEEKDKNIELSLERILDRLQSLENRLSKVETIISPGFTPGISPAYSETDYEAAESKVEEEESGAFFETNIGKYGLGWIANIVFIFGIAYIMSYVRSEGYSVLSTVLGLGGVASMFVFSYLLRNTFSFISYLINICAYLLLFYVAGSLYFFSDTPLLTSKVLDIILLVLASGGQLYFSIRRKSEALAGIGIVMLLTTAILSNTTHLMLPLASLAAIVAVYLFTRYEWWRLLLLSIILVYATHLLWLFNNPLMGNPFEAVAAHQNNLIYLFFYGAIFSLPMIFRHWETAKDPTFVSIMLLNGILFFITTLLVILFLYPENYAWIFGLLSVFCLFYSAVLKLRSPMPYTKAFYACYGFIALSVAIYGYYGLPNSFFLLALESLLVVSIAIWYRSTIIVVVNSLLFLFLLLFYLIISDSVDSINIVFAVTGLVTARILNWKKERLSLRTELFRNLYLVATFVMVLYALYHIVPSRHVTVAWTVAAVLYFLLSFVLKNIKYRWMAIGTLLVTAFYLFFIDFKNMDMGYRIIAFLFFAVISLGTSLYYTKRITKKDDQE